MVYRWVEVLPNKYTYSVWQWDETYKRWDWYIRDPVNNFVVKQNINFKPWYDYPKHLLGSTKLEGPPTMAERLQAGIIDHQPTILDTLNNVSTSNSDTVTVVGTSGTAGYALISGTGSSNSTTGGGNLGGNTSNTGNTRSNVRSNTSYNVKTAENINKIVLLFIILFVISLGLLFFLGLNLYYPVLNFDYSFSFI